VKKVLDVSILFLFLFFLDGMAVAYVCYETDEFPDLKIILGVD